MDIALDTNVLAYAEGVGDAQRQALALIERLPPARVRLPAQVLGELVRVLYGKAGRSRADARQAALEWADGFTVLDSSWPAMLGARNSRHSCALPCIASAGVQTSVCTPSAVATLLLRHLATSSMQTALKL